MGRYPTQTSGHRTGPRTKADARRSGPYTERRRGRPYGTRQVWVRVALPVSLGLWLASLRAVDLGRMRDLGLLQVLPVMFWVALGLLALGFCTALSDRRTPSGWFAGYVLGLIAVIHATPSLLYPTLRYGWAWKHVAIVDAVIRNGGTVPNAGKLELYNQWPGFFQLNAFFLQATGLDSALGYAAWTPPVFNALLLAPLLLVYRAVTRDRRLIWAAAWIYYSCSWVGQDYFAPQAFAFLLFVTLIALVMAQLPSSARRLPAATPIGWTVGRFAVVLLLEGVIICSHPLTPLMMISALVALSLPRRNRRVVLPVAAGAVLLTAVWDTTVARPYVSSNLHQFLGALVQPDANVVSGLAQLGTAAPGQVEVSWVDRGLSAAVFLLAAVAFLTRRWTRRTGLPLLVVAPLPLLVANAYGGEMIFRAYLFALPAAALLVAALFFPWDRRPLLRVLVVTPVLLALLGGLLFGYYGKEAANYFTKDEVLAGRFVTSTRPGSLIVSVTSAVPGLDTHYDKHPHVQLDEQELSDRQRLARNPLAGLEPFLAHSTAAKPAYIVLSRAQAAECYLNGTLPADTVQRLESQIAKARGFTTVYRNKDAVVYRYQNAVEGGGR